MRFTLCCILCSVLAFGSNAFGFTDDEFNGASLGAHWTWHDSAAPTTGSVYSMTGSALRMVSQKASDLWMTADQQCFVEQDAPTGTDWEVVTKIDSFDPTTSTGRGYERTGIQLWQDNDHYVAIGAISNANATMMGVQAFWQTDPVPARHNDRYCGSSDFWPVTTSPLYLKVQKTTKGYRAMMSGDGAAWTEVLPLVRNPETVDGYFATEKLRLYQSGGNQWETVTAPCTAADFDYVRSAAVAPTVVGAGMPDEFNGTSIDSSTWKIYEGVPQGTVAVADGKLKLHSGRNNDLWGHLEMPMYVYQDAPTSYTFGLTVKAGPTDLRSYSLYNSYGIWLWQDQCNWVFIGNQRSDTVTNRLEIAYKRAGLFDFYYQDFGTGACPEYLRIVKSGATNYIAQYSFNNTAWQSVPGMMGIVYPAALANAQVRLYSKSVNVDPPYVTAEFDWFHVDANVTAAGDWQLLE